MYRQYKYLPEVNRPCCRATRSREYQAHIDALHRIQTHKGAIDTSHPNTPQTIGRNYKRYEHEKQRNLQIRKDNMRLIGKMDKISREEHYPRAPPQRPYTLQGSRQKDEMRKITHENHKLLNAVQDRKPILNRNDWLMHRLDHQYQLNKMSEYKQTVPMSEIMKQELRTSQGFGGSSYAGSTRRSSAASTARKSYSRSSRGQLEDEANDRADTLLGNSGHEEDGPLEDQFNQNTNGLLGGGEEEENRSQGGQSQGGQSHGGQSQGGQSQGGQSQEGEDQNEQDQNENQDENQEENQEASDRQSTASKNSKGRLEEHMENAANGLFGNAGNNESEKSDKGELEQHVDDTANALLG